MPAQSASHALIDVLSAIVGPSQTITDETKMQPYCKGFRFGSGEAIAVLKPKTLLHIWHSLQAVSYTHLTLPTIYSV